MTARALTTDQRVRARSLYAALRGPAGVGLFPVPAWVLKAYVEAAVTGGDRADACARAHFGVVFAGLGPGGQDCVRGWADRLGAAERAAEVGV